MVYEVYDGGTGWNPMADLDLLFFFAHCSVPAIYAN
jgi:hypothetical protein